MLFLINICGPSGWALLAVSIISLAYIILAITHAVRTPRKDFAGYTRHAVLFWGGIAAVLGFLSQCAAIFEAMTAIMAATALDPEIIREGFGQSFIPSFWGFSILLMCAVVWIILGIAERGGEESQA